MITTMAKDYAKDISNHIVDIFEARTKDYIFVRLNDEKDHWYLPDLSVANKKLLATYIYRTAASQDATWPDIEPAIDKSKIGSFAAEIDLGPKPITEPKLAANPHHYLPWLYKILKRLEKLTIIKEPEPQRHVSKAYVHRKLREVCKNSFPKL